MKSNKKKRLDLGCGISKRPGFIGVDNLILSGVDIRHDLNKFPYPFKTNEIDEIWMDQTLEHLKEPLKVMEEIYRICRQDAKVFIGVPYFRSFYTAIDPTHKNFFGVQWFNYFDPDHAFFKKYHYTKAKFKVQKIEFDREFKKNIINFFHRKLIGLAEKYPVRYEIYLSHLFPLNSLTFHLRVIK